MSSDTLSIQPLDLEGKRFTTNGPLAYVWWSGIAIDHPANATILEAVSKASGVKSCRWHTDPKVGERLFVEREERPYWGNGTGAAICDAIASITGQQFQLVLYGADGNPRTP